MSNNQPPDGLVKQGKVWLEFWPEEFNLLQREIEHHPELRMNLSLHPAEKWEERLAEVAVYCGVLLDGYYSRDRLIVVARTLLDILKSKRTGEVLVLGPEVSFVNSPPSGKST